MTIKTINSTAITSYVLYLLRLSIFFTSLIFSLNNSSIIILWEIFSCFNSTFFFPIILDPIGLIFSSTVLFISGNVIKFSQTYMIGETFIKRFTHLVILFIISINLLIFFPNLITLLLGWDGLGLVRFILVIYYQNAKSLRAGMITALTNRIGDAALLLSIGWTINTNNWSIFNMWNNSLSNFIIISILIAAITKRAQIPFSRWLPAAIAAPTPVSALVHSSTLVTAGVFLLIRFYPFLSTFKQFNVILLCTASLTICIAGLSALRECDLKKIIALSTLRQLGVIIGRLGLGLPKLAFFHLITHALFKALLFVCAGSIIDQHHHNQDLRIVGNLTQQIPLTISCFLVANISLCGLPFLSGFYSKDLILESSLFSSTNWVILTIFFVATGLTIAYSLRFVIIVNFSPISSSPTHSILNSDLNISTPSLALTLGAICAGSIINWLNSPTSQNLILETKYKTFPLTITILSILLTWIRIKIFFPNNIPTIFSIKKSHEASCHIWYLAPLSSQAIIPLPFFLSHQFLKTLDQGWRETLSAQGTFYLFSSISKTIQSTQKNHIIIILNIISAPIILCFIIF